MAPIAAKHGAHRRLKIRKAKAALAVAAAGLFKALCDGRKGPRSSASDIHILVLEDAHGRVLALLVGDAVKHAEHADHFFLATRPITVATVDCQLPKPRGWKIGATAPRPCRGWNHPNFPPRHHHGAFGPPAAVCAASSATASGSTASTSALPSRSRRARRRRSQPPQGPSRSWRCEPDQDAGNENHGAGAPMNDQPRSTAPRSTRQPPGHGRRKFHDEGAGRRRTSWSF